MSVVCSEDADMGYTVSVVCCMCGDIMLDTVCPWCVVCVVSDIMLDIVCPLCVVCRVTSCWTQCDSGVLYVW